jgi:hypothetical protein
VLIDAKIRASEKDLPVRNYKPIFPVHEKI